MNYWYLNNFNIHFLLYKLRQKKKSKQTNKQISKTNRKNVSLFQAFGWWGAGQKLGRRRKIDEGKNRAGKGRERLYTGTTLCYKCLQAFSRSRSSLPSFFSPRVSFCAGRVRFNLLPTIKRLEQAKRTLAGTPQPLWPITAGPDTTKKNKKY